MLLRISTFLALLSLLACVKKSNPTPQLASGRAFVLPSDSLAEVFKSRPVPPWAPKIHSYKPSAERKWDLIHTRLDLIPDWEKQQLKGKAILRLEPYFYPQDSVFLDARGFEIRSLELKSAGRILPFAFTYDGNRLAIGVGRRFVKGESIEILIDYTAKPTELPKGGSAAITSDQGLYFINHDGKKADMPRQIWTQGETQGARCWFPTIDEPNEKCTQEMRITVEEKYRSLSNGILTSSTKDGKGLRTDVWEMKLPHSPYLFMMAIGEYSVVSDKWGKIPLQYWVEPKFKDQAKRIFGRTPAMIDFFSTLLDYPFPWPKYDQVVVRNFVSGAMENTSASVFMEALQVGPKELVDHNWDGIIAHELFHQWFGDLVTLESWANLPLNESFANYSEYLWDEHRLGRDDADLGGLKEKYQYLYESGTKREPLIRYNHNKPDDMFDSHSYAKGGRILHLLRKELGDEAFFGGLRLYLKRHAFKTVEIHDLRIALEEVSGRDLNWFFNQWFLRPGHPEISTESYFSGKTITLITHQEQDTSYFPVYRLNIPVVMKVKGKTRREILRLSTANDTFSFAAESEPELILWDSDASYLGILNVNESPENLRARYRYAERGIHRLQALEELRKDLSESADARQLVKDALKDPFWACRETALEALQELDSLEKQSILPQAMRMAETDQKPDVRKEALKLLAGLQVPEKKKFLEKALKDSSMEVSSEAFRQYLAEEYPDMEEKRRQLESDPFSNYQGVLSSFYAAREGQASYDWFLQHLEKPAGTGIYELIKAFGDFLAAEKDPRRLQSGFDLLVKIGMEGSRPEEVIAAYQVLRGMSRMPEAREKRKAIREKHRNDDFADILEYLE